MRQLLIIIPLVIFGCTRPETDDSQAETAAVLATLATWNQFVQAGTYDSLAHLVTTDFSFTHRGIRQSFIEVRKLLESYQATDLKIVISNERVRTSGDLGFALIDDHASFRSGNRSISISEVGLIVFRRDNGQWLIDAWVVSPRS